MDHEDEEAEEPEDDEGDEDAKKSKSKKKRNTPSKSPSKGKKSPGLKQFRRKVKPLELPSDDEEQADVVLDALDGKM